MTLFTDAMSHLPSNQLTNSMLIPLPRHDFEVCEALGGDDLGLVHAAHVTERFAQAVEVDARCNGKRNTRKLVDRRARNPHAERESEPKGGEHRTYRKYSGSPVMRGNPASAESAKENAEGLRRVVHADSDATTARGRNARHERRQQGLEHVERDEKAEHQHGKRGEPATQHG